jgi:hypothetical protein
MIITKITVKSEKSVMTSATGDVTAGIELEATLTAEEAANAEHVASVVKWLQGSADQFVEQHLRSKLSS